MAIKQRKQLTGTTAQINAYAGVEGQLVWNKTTKRWVGMSGTAGTNYPMASERHQHSIANVTDLQKTLDSKATKTELTEGLAGKANSSHTHTITNVTGLQDALNAASTQASNAIPKNGNRGAIGGYESASAVTTITGDSPDSMATGIGGTILEIHVNTGSANQSWTKVVYLTQNVNVILGSKWVWAGGKAPTIKAPGVLVFHWNNSGGIATHTAGAS